jgi:hypothetical protein
MVSADAMPFIWRRSKISSLAVTMTTSGFRVPTIDLCVRQNRSDESFEP